MRKSLYLVTYVNSEGEEEIMEVPAYSAAQAEFFSGVDNIVSMENTMANYQGCGHESHEMEVCV